MVALGRKKVARPHPSLLSQEKVQKKSVVRPVSFPIQKLNCPPLRFTAS
jgi:hypothetical protein